MPRFRRRPIACVLAVMVCQFLGGAVATVVETGAARSAATLACTCSLGADSECPMHGLYRKAPGEPRPGDRDCYCCNSRPPATDATLTCVFWGGALVDAFAQPAPDGPFEPVVMAPAAVFDRDDSPTSPPPRAC